MFATVREATFDAEKMAQGRGQMEEFARIRARQPGYRSSATVDAGDGRVLIVTLWETREQAEAAQSIMEPEARRLMGPLWTGQPRLIASGPVVHHDIANA
jgi:hypothetical protein